MWCAANADVFLHTEVFCTKVYPEGFLYSGSFTTQQRTFQKVAPLGIAPREDAQ